MVYPKWKHLLPEYNLFREKTMKRHALSNAEWESIKDLACYKPARGRAPAAETIRPFLNGIL